MPAPVPFLHHFTGSFIGQQLLLDQIDGDCSQRHSILYRRSHLLRKRGRTDLLTHRAPLLFGLVFDDQHALGRHINDLAALHLQRCDLAQIVLTVLAVVHRVDDHCIGSLRQLQRAPWMISLSSRLLAAFLAQALGLSMKAIRGGRQVAVVAIFGLLGFQDAQTLSQPRDLGSQGRILFSELVQFFVCGHTATLLACSSLCKPLVLLASYKSFN
jgi:hypothetical protein